MALSILWALGNHHRNPTPTTKEKIRFSMDVSHSSKSKKKHQVGYCDECGSAFEKKRKDHRFCSQRCWRKAYNRRPEVKEKNRQRMKEYNERPKVKKKRREHNQRPEVKAYQKEYRQRPENREKNKEYQRIYRQI